MFYPVAVETFGVLADEAHEFISEIGRRASLSTADPRETTFVYQRISAAIQRFNAVRLSNTFTISESPLWPFQTPHTLLNVSHPGNEVPGSKKK